MIVGPLAARYMKTRQPSVPIHVPDCTVRLRSPDTFAIVPNVAVSDPRARVDTGADICMLPHAWKSQLRLDAQHVRSYCHAFGNWQEVFSLDITMCFPSPHGAGTVTIDAVPVFFGGNNPCMLIGIRDCLERCNLRIDWQSRAWDLERY